MEFFWSARNLTPPTEIKADDGPPGPPPPLRVKAYSMTAVDEFRPVNRDIL